MLAALLLNLGTGASVLAAQFTTMSESGGLTVFTAPTIEPNREPNTGLFSVPFTVKNIGTTTLSAISLTCVRTGPVVCGTVTPSSRSSLAPGASFNVTVRYSTGAVGSGSVGLRAADDFGAIANGERLVTVAPAGKPAVALLHPSVDVIDRGLCLTTGAGEAAGVSCGDLFVVHSMPAYRTLGRDRSLALSYNSAAAAGLTLVPATVAQPATIAMPSKYKVVLTVGSSKDSAEYLPPAISPTCGWPCAPYSDPQQVVLGRALTGQPTGIYPVMLSVRNIYPSSTHDSVVTGSVLVVNRSTSEFGQGWSLLGVEQVLTDPVDSTKLVWLAGDGSIRRYQSTPGGNVFQGAPADAPDSLVRFDSVGTSWYRRDLKHGSAITFDYSGRHRTTRNRVGAITTFTWSTVAGQPRLVFIVVPPNNGSNPTYTLSYDGTTGALTKITDPSGRELNVTITSGALTALADPDGYQTTFGYTAGKMTSRTNRRGIATLYQFSNASRLTKVTAPAGNQTSDTATAVTQFKPWDERGLAVGATGQVAIRHDLVSTTVYGPRHPTVADTAAFQIDRWGAPTKVTNGIGATTTIVRGDASNPALVTRVTYPNGRIATMTYNGRGNLTEVRDSTSHLGSAGLATKVSRYTYTSAIAPDSPDTVSDALERRVKYAYNSLGLTDSVVDARGHRTKFFYNLGASDPLKGSVDSIAERGVETWRQSDFGESVGDQAQRFAYDTQGNLKTSTGPAGVTTSYTRDALGRVTGIYDPLGTRRGMGYDPINRMTQDTQYTAKHANPYSLNPLAGCDAAQLSCADTVPSTFVPALSGSLVTRYVYGASELDTIVDPRAVKRAFSADLRGLPRQETDEFGNPRTATHDRGGLLTSSISRSNVTVRYRYDVVGRRTAMIFPLQDYSAGCQPSPACTTALQVPGDSLSYTYDTMGNQLTAKNQQGTITRTYYADGSLKSQISQLNSLIPDTLLYEYDAVGARTRVIHGRDVRDTTTYRYNTATGSLDTLDFGAAGLGNTYRVLLQYDGLGRRRQVTYPNGTVVSLKYDAAGILRQVVSSHPGGPSANPNADILDFTLRQELVNPAGLITREKMTCSSGLTYGNPCGSSSPRTTLNQYNRLGMLVRQQVGSAVDSMGYDGSGNMLFRRDGATGGMHSFTMTSSPASNRMQADALKQMNFLYTADGARDQEYSSANAYSTRFFYYDGLGRMTGSWHFVNVGGSLQPHNNATACLYDADGQMSNPCDNGAPRLAYDGHNVIATPKASSNGPTWRFVHGPGLDDPLLGLWRSGNGVQKVYYWITDGQGRHLAFADSTGFLDSDDYTLRYGQGGGKYAGGTGSASTFKADRFSSPEMPGLSFFRNRAYDQETGRWTQEDPIGVAGGLNLYQFNGNNPVAYTDPFGLCPDACIIEGGIGAAGIITGLAIAVTALVAGDELSDALDQGVRGGAGLIKGAIGAIGAVFSSAHAKGVDRTNTSLNIAQEHLNRIGGLGPNDPDPSGKKRDWIKDAKKHLGNAQKYVEKVKGKTRDELQRRIDDVAKQIDDQVR